MDHSIPTPGSADSFRSCYSSFRSLEKSDSCYEGDPHMQDNVQIEEIPSDQIGRNSSSSSNRSLLHSESYYEHDPYMYDNMQIEEIPSSFGSYRSGSSFSRSLSRRSEVSVLEFDAPTEELKELLELKRDVRSIRNINSNWATEDLTRMVECWHGSVVDKVAQVRTLQKRGRTKRLSFFPWRNKIAVVPELKQSILELKSEGKILVNALRSTLAAHEEMLAVVRESVKNHSRIGIIGMGGVGKTTLVRKFLASENSDNDVDFDVVIWLTSSLYGSGIRAARRMQDDVARQLNLSLDQNDAAEARAVALFNALSKIQFLLVLDDLWGFRDLSKIGIPRCNARNRCVMVITSRSGKVCEAMGASSIIKLPLHSSTVVTSV